MIPKEFISAVREINGWKVFLDQRLLPKEGAITIDVTGWGNYRHLVAENELETADSSNCSDNCKEC